MPKGDIEDLFAQISAFEWDERKREHNRREHKIDFEDVRAIFNSYTFIRRSDRRGEIRYQIFGYVDGREVAVACTVKEGHCRLISARRARKDERKKYYGGLEGRSPTGDH